MAAWRALAVTLALLGACSVDDATFSSRDAGPDALPAQGPVRLTLQRAGSGAGAVRSDTGGLDCGATCSISMDLGATLTLIATPAAGSVFAGWTGACSGTALTCRLTVERATEVTATFELATYPVSISMGGSGQGRVAATRGALDCPGACAAELPHGTEVTFTAAASAGSDHVGWATTPAGLCSGTGPCTLTLAGPLTVTATFARQNALEVVKTGTGDGAVTSAPMGIDCGMDCSEIYPPGTSVTLTAVADGTSTFAGWSGGGCSGVGACTVSVDAAMQVTAMFMRQQRALTVNKSGAGVGTVTSNPAGIDCGTTCSANYELGRSVTLTAAAAAGSLFVGWSGAGCSGTSTCTVTITAATDVTATFQPILHVIAVTRDGTGAGTVSSTPAGIDCGMDCSEPFPQGGMVLLTATAAPGSAFTGWSGGGCSGTGPCMLAVTAATTVTATFTAQPFALTVTRIGTGSGTVSSNPTGIDCGVDCTETYLGGSQVTLTAAAATGSTFTGWTGAGCSGTGACIVAMTGARSVTATFALDRHTLSVTKAGAGAGTVSSAPAGINCGASCLATYDYGTSVTLSAVAATGSAFTGWTGAGCSGTGACTVAMTAARSVTATFALNSYSVNVQKTGSGAGYVSSSPAGLDCGPSCTASFPYGTVLTLTASAATGSSFGGWSGAGCSGTGACTFTVTADTILGASFATNDYLLSVTKAGAGAGTITSSPAGINCGATCSAPFRFGTTVTLTAAAATGSTFTGWSGAGCSGTGTCTVAINGAADVVATFGRDRHVLSVTRTGDGLGAVSSTPSGIDCGPTCSAAYDYGTRVTLSAVPDPGYVFVGWSGPCSGTDACSVVVTGATDVTATFARDRYPLSIAKYGSGVGAVRASPDGINCGLDCVATYPYGTVITLSATPAYGSIFVAWNGAGCPNTSEATCTFTLTAATTVDAVFVRVFGATTQGAVMSAPAASAAAPPAAVDDRSRRIVVVRRREAGAERGTR